MKKILRRAAAAMIAAILAVLCICGCAGSEKMTYTVTVTGAESDVIQAARVQLKQGEKVCAEKNPQNGIAEFELPAGTYTATVVGLEGYEWTDQTLTAENASVTIALTRAETDVSYTVKVTLPNGEPVSAILVLLCTADPATPGAVCNPAVTDQNGNANFLLPPMEYLVHIEEGQKGFPADYTFDNTRYTMDSAGGSLTVTLQAKA